jgi:hypothetical protein
MMKKLGIRRLDATSNKTVNLPSYITDDVDLYLIYE